MSIKSTTASMSFLRGFAPERRFLHFIGIILPDSVPENILKAEFTGTIVEWKRIGSYWCLCYKDHWNIGQSTDRDRVALDQHQLQHFINVLKRVRNESLYQSYPDDLGLKHLIILEDQDPVPVSVRVKPFCRSKK